MELAKFVFVCITTGITLIGAIVGVFLFFGRIIDKKIKAVDQKTENAKCEFESAVKELQVKNDKSFEEMRGELRSMQRTINDDFQRRLSNIEGSLKSTNNILNSIQQWFINNTPAK